jgi:hypothetical protein
MKKRSLSTVKKELDRVFSEYIRKRDADLDGYITCVSCKKRYTGRILTVAIL